MIEGSGGFGFYVSDQHIFQVLSLDLFLVVLAGRNLLLLLFNLLEMFNRLRLISRQYQVIKFFNGALSYQLIFFIGLKLEVSDLLDLIFQAFVSLSLFYDFLCLFLDLLP